MKFVDENKKPIGHRLRGVNVEKNKIRLLYVAIEKINSIEGEAKLSKTYGVSNPFLLPYGMTIEDACKVLSYLSEKVETEQKLETASLKSVMAISGVLEEYGFKKIEDCSHGVAHTLTPYNPAERVEGIKKSPVHGVIDLFTVGGHMKRFEKSGMKSRYFDWYTPGVEKSEIDMIYARIADEEKESE